MALAFLLAGCPPASPDGTGGGSAGGESAEAQAGETAPTLPPSPLDPWASVMAGRARDAVGPRGEIVALIVRADVATESERGLSWMRVGLVLGPFGLRVFERMPRAITGAEHGAVPDGIGPLAVARAVASRPPPLGDEDCAALPTRACEALRATALEVVDPPDAAIVRIQAAQSGALAVGAAGEVWLADSDRGIVTLLASE